MRAAPMEAVEGVPSGFVALPGVTGCSSNALGVSVFSGPCKLAPGRTFLNWNQLLIRRWKHITTTTTTTTATPQKTGIRRLFEHDPAAVFSSEWAIGRKRAREAKRRRRSGCRWKGN